MPITQTRLHTLALESQAAAASHAALADAVREALLAYGQGRARADAALAFIQTALLAAPAPDQSQTREELAHYARTAGKNTTRAALNRAARARAALCAGHDPDARAIGSAPDRIGQGGGPKPAWLLESAARGRAQAQAQAQALRQATAAPRLPLPGIDPMFGVDPRLGASAFATATASDEAAQMAQGAAIKAGLEAQARERERWAQGAYGASTGQGGAGLGQVPQAQVPQAQAKPTFPILPDAPVPPFTGWGEDQGGAGHGGAAQGGE